MKKLQNNFTTPEQSKRLLELGVPVDSSDCYYLHEHDDRVYLFQNQKESDNCISKIRLRLGLGHAMPCWSVGRLMEVYDTCIPDNGDWPNYFKYGDLLEYAIDCIDVAIEKELIDFSKLEE